MTATANTGDVLLAAEGVTVLEARSETADKGPRVEVVAYSGNLMVVPLWGTVGLDLSGLDVSGQVPLLADHDARVGGVVGHGEARIADGRLLVTGVLSGAGEAAGPIDLGTRRVPPDEAFGPLADRLIHALPDLPPNDLCVTAASTRLAP